MIISTIAAFAIIGLGIFGNKILGKTDEKEDAPIKKVIASIYVDQVKNTHRSIQITSTGLLVAKNRIDISSEVQGIFQSSKLLFKPGEKYYKGDILLRINSDEFRANLQVQKSNFYQRLISVLPDLKLDYTQQFDKWNTYIKDFDMEKSVQPLPRFDTEQEKLFITGKGILSAYYSVKNLQERIDKFTIRAPFTGVLTRANVNKGALINPGQNLGSFINPDLYELEVTVDSKSANIIKLGSSIKLQSLDKNNSWTGTVSRINPIINPQTQSASFFVDVAGKNLNDGMYLEAILESENQSLVYEIDRSLIDSDNHVFVMIKDSILHAKPIEIFHLNNKTALISGLKDGDLVMSQPLPGAFDGKIVKLIKE